MTNVFVGDIVVESGSLLKDAHLSWSVQIAQLSRSERVAQRLYLLLLSRLRDNDARRELFQRNSAQRAFAYTSDVEACAVDGMVSAREEHDAPIPVDGRHPF
jgi:hypothetical protein